MRWTAVCLCMACKGYSTEYRPIGWMRHKQPAGFVVKIGTAGDGRGAIFKLRCSKKDPISSIARRKPST